MRKMWLKNITTGEIWDLLPDNPNLTDGGCALIDPNGLGYQQRITQEQVEVAPAAKGVEPFEASLDEAEARAVAANVEGPAPEALAKNGLEAGK